MPTLNLNKSFSTRTERSERVIKVAEAFGLGLEDKDWTVLDNLSIDINPGDVVYICGQSGAGKSVLLREISAGLAKDLKVAKIDDVEFEDKPIIDQLGSGSMAEAIRLLSIAGLSDAYLYIRKPQELSDGQKYRFRIAKLIESDADVWIADEFGAVLDRVTAKVLSYNVQKISRALSKILVLATTHTDLVQELSPSLLITKKFHDRITIDDTRIAA